MRPARLKTTPALLLAGIGFLMQASMIWVILTEIRLSDGFWPADIGSHVVSAFGGTVNSAILDYPKIELSWLSVAIRLAIMLASAAVIAAGIALCRSRMLTTPPFRRTFVSAWWLSIAAITRPWLLAGLWLIAWLVATSVSDPGYLSFLLLTTPLFAAMIAALSLNGFWDSCAGGDQSHPIDPIGRRMWVLRHREILVVLLAAICWEATSFWMNERLYAGLLVPHGDSAMYEEHLWNVWHGKGFRSYLDQGLFLGEHIQVIHLLLLPLHMIWPSYLMMELVASCSLAICVVPLFSIAKRHSGSSRAAMWLALAWLLFFPMHFLDIAIDLKTLRPSCYGLPFLFWGIDFAERRRLISSSVCFLIALTTQEDFALVVGSIGAVLFLISRRETAADGDSRIFARWTIGLTVFSVAWVLLAVLVVIPAFRGGEVVHYSRYFGDLGNSPGDLVRTVLRHPGKVLAQLLSLRTLFYVLVLTVPLGLSPLRRPLYLCAGAATFAMLSLIQLGNSSGAEAVAGLSELPPIPYHHFHAPLLPVLFWAAAASLKPRSDAGGKSASRPAIIRWMSELQIKNPVTAARLAFLCAVCTGISGSLMSVGATFWSGTSPFGYAQLYVPGDRATEFQKVLAVLPEHSRVASTDYVHTRLTHFDRSYDYSDYVRAVNNYQPGVPADTDYIVIDTGHRYSAVRTLGQARELREEPDKWEVAPIDTRGLFIVLKRKKPSSARNEVRGRSHSTNE